MIEIVFFCLKYNYSYPPSCNKHCNIRHLECYKYNLQMYILYAVSYTLIKNYEYIYFSSLSLSLSLSLSSLSLSLSLSHTHSLTNTHALLAEQVFKWYFVAQ